VGKVISDNGYMWNRLCFVGHTVM